MKPKGTLFLIIILFVGYLVYLIVSGIAQIISVIASAIAYLIQPIGWVLLICGVCFLIYQIYVFVYFNSNKFKSIRDSIQDYIKNCNDLNHHIQDLKCSYLNIKSYDYGESDLKDSSNYNFKKRNGIRKLKIT